MRIPQPESELTRFARAALDEQGRMGASWSILWAAQSVQGFAAMGINMNARGEPGAFSYAKDKQE